MHDQIKKILFLIAGSGIILICSGCNVMESETTEYEGTEYTKQQEENSENNSARNNDSTFDNVNTKDSVTTDETSDFDDADTDTFGWGYTDGTISKTIDSFTITDIANGSESVAEFVSEEDAYVAYFSASITDQIVVLSTHDGGQNWNSVSVNCPKDYECGSGELLLSCIQDKDIFLLYLTDTGVDGSQGKVLYHSSDGGNSFEKIADISESIKNYPTVLVFHDKDKGILLVQNHGYSSFAYITTDGGITWESLILDFPTEEYGYLEGQSLVRADADDDIWELTLRDSNDINYVFYSNDGWVTWVLQEES